jgi:hypothetical protein
MTVYLVLYDLNKEEARPSTLRRDYFYSNAKLGKTIGSARISADPAVSFSERLKRSTV